MASILGMSKLLAYDVDGEMCWQCWLLLLVVVAVRLPGYSLGCKPVRCDCEVPAHVSLFANCDRHSMHKVRHLTIVSDNNARTSALVPTYQITKEVPLADPERSQTLTHGVQHFSKHPLLKSGGPPRGKREAEQAHRKDPEPP
jgi:hypothetical protein